MRLFPRTARQRFAAATAACTLALGALAVPLASADPKDLKDKQHQAEQQVEHAEHALEESSDRLQQARAALAAGGRRAVRRPRRVLGREGPAGRRRDPRPGDAGEARGRRAAARRRPGRPGRRPGRARRAAPRSSPTPSPTSTSRATRSCWPSPPCWSRETTADLTRQAELTDAIVGREARAYDDLHAAEVLLQVRENEVESARDDVELQRQAAAEHLVTMEKLTTEARDAKESVRGLVDEAARRPGRPPSPLASRTAPSCREAKQRENHIKQLILAAARARQGRLQRPDQRAAHPAGPGLRHLAVRLPRAPDLPLLGPARRHRLRRLLRRADARRRRRHRDRASTSPRSTATGSTSASARSTARTSRPSTTTRPATGSASATASPRATPSARSAPPAGPPAATCTSRSW